jgi:hypothetical protein
MTTLFDSTAPAPPARARSDVPGTLLSGESPGDAWRPRSWDVSEIAGFARALSAELGTAVRRITLNPALWSEHPRLLPLPGRSLRIDWLDAAAADEVSVRRGYQPRLTVRLVPPTTGDPVTSRPTLPTTRS